MSTYEFSVPCLFGLEGIAGDELRRLDIPNVRVENGRVLFSGEARDMAKANICLRTGERVLIVLADFPAKTFEELFQGVYHANLEDFIPKDGSFPVKGHCLNSQLMSVPDCQAIVKKAASRRLGEKYGVSWLPETGAKYQLQFSIMNDRVQLYLDTSGQGLHKRGYRAVGNDAPLRETLAAAMVQLTRYRGWEFLWDPFCGSGTIPIEAALIARNAAAGLRRKHSHGATGKSGTRFGKKQKRRNSMENTRSSARTTTPSASPSPWQTPGRRGWATSSASPTATPPKWTCPPSPAFLSATLPTASGCWNSRAPSGSTPRWGGT